MIDGENESPWRHRSIPGTYSKETGLRWQAAAEPLLVQMGYRVLKAQHRRNDGIGRPILHAKSELDEYLWRFADYLVEKQSIFYIVDVKTQPYFITQVRGSATTAGRNAPIVFAEKEMDAYESSKVAVLILLIQYRADGKSSEFDPVYFGLVPFRVLQPKPGWRGLTLPHQPDKMLATLGKGEVAKLLNKVKPYDVETLTHHF